MSTRVPHEGPLCNEGALEDGPHERLGPHLPEFVYNGEVAISGISGRLPESDHVGEFRDHLLNKEDMVTADDRRWTVGLPLRSGKIRELGHFDAGFFGVHPKQADCMDPQLRLLLEVSYEAIVDAGQSLESVRGSKTGVFVGAGIREATDVCTLDRERLIPYCPNAMFANRISIFFDFRGPSYMVDTGCSTSMACLDQALLNIRMGLIDSALVGATNLLLNLNLSLQFAKLGAISTDGTCKTFDAKANGYCKGEAVMAVFLQKTADCKRIYATIVHTKANCDGYKEQGITFPSGISQQQLIREVYHDTGINPLDIKYMEAHGTGTKVGDPQETNSIVDVFCKGRNGPLLIGSTKSNMGHAEIASGLTSIAKIIIAMEEKVIPPNLHYVTPNPDIPGLTDGSLQVVTKCTPWEGGLIAMNCCGFGGVNVHAIFRSHDKEYTEPHVASEKVRLFTCSARTEDGVKKVLAAARKNAKSVEFQTLIQESANLPTNVVPYRGYTLLNAASELEEVQRCSEDHRPVWFVFAGMGTQWHGMGRQMMELPVFRESIQQSTEILSRYDINLYDLIMNGDESTFDQTIPSFIGIVSIQVALVDVLTSLNIKPDGIIGHSVGELGCAYADGSLTAEETVLAAYWQGKCVSETKLPPGKMAAVGLSWEECKKLCPPGVVPACHNSVDTVTNSGSYEATPEFVEELKAKDMFARDVKSSNVAYHSYHINDIVPQLKAALATVITPKRRSPKWVSTSVPESRWGEELAQYSSADYHVNNLVSAVLFQEGLQKVPNNAIAIEIAPHCLLQAILKWSLGSDAVFVGLMNRFHENNLEYFFSSLGKCFANGMNMSPMKAYPPVQFPVPRGTPMVGPVISHIWDHSSLWDVPREAVFMASKGGSASDTVFEIDISEESPDHYLAGHVVDGKVLFPAAGYLFLTWNALARLKCGMYQKLPVVFQDVYFHRATILYPTGTVKLRVSIMPATGEFEICEHDSLVASGFVSTPEGTFMDRDQYSLIQEMSNRKVSTEFDLTKEEFYKDLRLKGYEYGPTFQGVIRASQTGETGDIIWNGRWISFIDTMLHLLVTVGRTFNLPTRVESVKVDPKFQPPAPAEGEEPVRIPAFVDHVLDVLVCGGVEIKGMHASVAPKRSMQTAPTLEEHRFVPFIDSSDVVISSSLEQYTTDCVSFTLENLDRLLKDDSTDSLPNKELLHEVVAINRPATGSQLQDKLSQPNTGLAQALVNIFKLPLSTTFKENVRNLLQQLQPELASDQLLSSLNTQDILKPCVDIVLSNVLTNKITVFEAEANQSALYRQIIPLIKGEPLKGVTYTVADKSGLHKDAKSLGVKPSQWDLGTSTSLPPGQVHLLVLKNVLHKQADIDSSFQTVSGIVLPEGFILVEEVTRNFSLYLALEALAEKLAGDSSSTNSSVCRVYGRYLTEGSWVEIFSRHGYEVVYRRSDNLLSTMFLLRKKAEIKTAPILFSIDDLECNWLEDLKAQMKNLETAPEDARFWLVAEQATNGIVGFFNCLRLEAGGDKVRSIFISNLKSDSRPQITVASPEFQSISQKDLTMNVYRDGQWGSFRHILVSEGGTQKETTTNYAYVNTTTRGDLSSLKWMESPLQYLQKNGHNTDLCSVYYTSLNFRDVMLATGKLVLDNSSSNLATRDCVLGFEFSGRDSTGRRVMGIKPCKSLATIVDTESRSLWEVPDNWTMEEAATVPVVYCTAYYALVTRGRIRKGERVLIHSGSGGVGQAAISVALSYDCEVFTTVGSQEKKEYLKRLFPQLKDRNFSNSRDLSFEFDILKKTNGEGVDIVLNSLADDKLQASVRLLAKHGRFLEIGKFDMSNNSPLDMSIFLENVSFIGIMLETMLEHNTYEWEEVYNLMCEGMATGVVKPLKTTVFSKEQVEDAFRFMTQGEHIGKVLIQVRSEEQKKVIEAPNVSIPVARRTLCDPCKSYIITGGLGGFGLELAQWLVERGARILVLSSRTGMRTGYQYKKVQQWRDAGVTVVISKKDISFLEGAQSLLEESSQLGPVGGLFKSALVLRDGLFEHQTNEMFQAVCEPKVQGTIHLDQATRELCKDSLDLFVVFSSICCGRGNLGQTNYGFANSVMERICEKRKVDGFPALAIQWGVIGDVGVVMESMGNNQTIIRGTFPQRIASCLNVLDLFLNQNYTIVSSFVLAQSEITETKGRTHKGNLVDSVARIFGVKDVSAINPDTCLADLGLDSFMGVEIKQLLERDFDLSLSIREIRMLTTKKLQEINEAHEAVIGSQKSEVTITTDVYNSTELSDTSLPSRYDLDHILPQNTIINMNGVQDGLKPLFIVHPLEGNVIALQTLASCLPCPVYGLQLTAQAPLTSIEALATYYLQHLTSVDPKGPYRIAGYSFGAAVAIELANQLRKQNPDRGDVVQSLTLLDGSHRRVEMYTSVYRKVMQLRTPAEEQAVLLCGFIKQFITLDHASIFRDMVAAAGFEDRLKIAVDLLMDTGKFRSREDLETLANALYSMLIISESYKPGHVNGDITLIRVQESSAQTSSLGHDYGLKQICSGKVDVHVVNGNHETFILGENAKHVASILIPLLQQSSHV